jgi:hypothetical protein
MLKSENAYEGFGISLRWAAKILCAGGVKTLVIEHGRGAINMLQPSLCVTNFLIVKKAFELFIDSLNKNFFFRD